MGKRRYLALNDQSQDSEEHAAVAGIISPIAISVPAAQPLTVMNVRRVYTSPLPNGAELTLSVDKERFHCCEVLFHPDPINSDEGSCRDNSIVSTILRAAEAVDASVRPDVCARIIVFGRTALVPGLLLRLQEELRDRLRALGVEEFVIAGTEEPTRGPADDDDDVLLSSAHDGVTIYGSRAPSFAPSASWRGASERVKWSRDFPIVTQNIMTDTDYHEFGPHVIEDFLAGIM
jgi:actin-related protein